MFSKEKEPEIVELTREEVAALDSRLERNELTTKDTELVRRILKFYSWMQFKFLSGQLSNSKLRKLLFGSRTEKRKKKAYSVPAEDAERKSEGSNLVH